MNFYINISVIWTLILTSYFCFSQSANSSNKQVLNNIFSYEKNQAFNLVYKDVSELILLGKNGATKLGKNNIVDAADLVRENRYLNIYDNIVNQIQLSKNYVFFNAVISPFSGKIAFVERVLYKPIWNLRIYDPVNNTYELVYNEKNCPIAGICPRPIGWSNNDNLLLDGFDINVGIENQGLWQYTFENNSLNPVVTKGKYIGTPLVTPNGESFLYTASSEPTKDILHGITDEIWVKDFNSSTDKLFKSGASFSLKGWTTKSGESLSVITSNSGIAYKRKNDRKVKLPFIAGTKIYVTRHGKEDPKLHGNSPGNGILCYDDGDGNDRNNYHDDKIAIDFSNLESGCVTGGTGNDQIPIVASETGTVIFSEFGTNSNGNNGYGELVKVATDGEHITYYAHLSTRVVNENNIVSQGILIGYEGKTGTVQEHLHQEFRDTNDEPSTRHYLEYEDINGIPTYGYMYTSLNAPVPAFVCKQSCQVDLSPDCPTLNYSINNSSITFSSLSISNDGNYDAIPYQVKYYLSTTNYINASSYSLGMQNMPGLLSGYSHTIPAISYSTLGIPANNYYVIALVDHLNINDDANFYDNDCYTQNTIHIGNINPTSSCFDNIQNSNETGVDCGGTCQPCQIVNLKSTTCATPIVNGDEVTILYEIMNTGSINSGPFYTGWSLKEVGSSNFSSFGVLAYNSGINAGTSESLSVVFDLDQMMDMADLQAGNYELYMSIDILNDVTESSESDNWCTNLSTINYTENCDPNGNFQGAYNGTFYYAVPNYINSPAQGNQCTILPGSDVTLTAGNYLMLKPGFLAEYNSNFLAFIDGCGGAFKTTDTNEEVLLNSFDLNETDIDLSTIDLSINPNPFTDQSIIQFSHLSTNTPVTVFVTDMMGNKVVSLADNEQMNNGIHQLIFDGSDLPAGMYYCTLMSGDMIKTEKVMITK